MTLRKIGHRNAAIIAQEWSEISVTSDFYKGEQLVAGNEAYLSGPVAHLLTQEKSNVLSFFTQCLT